MFYAAIPFAARKPHPKAKFSMSEDELLAQSVAELGTGDWRQVANRLPGRNGRQCRDRWFNYVSPTVINAPWTSSEELLLIEKFREFGPVWKYIATFFSCRSEVNVNNHWRLMARRVIKHIRQGRVSKQTVAEPRAAQSPHDNLLHMFNSATAADYSWSDADAETWL
jgi:hypothetical protein